MKKLLLFLLVLTLAACSDSGEKKSALQETDSVPFEIAAYKENISPVLSPMAPYIILAQTEDQLEKFATQFDIEANLDMTQYSAALLVTNSDSCGIVIDSVYDIDNKLVVKLVPPGGSDCDKEAVPHTFVVQVDKKDYDVVQLYQGEVIKSSLNLK